MVHDGYFFKICRTECLGFDQIFRRMAIKLMLLWKLFRERHFIKIPNEYPMDQIVEKASVNFPRPCFSFIFYWRVNISQIFMDNLQITCSIQKDFNETLSSAVFADTSRILGNPKMDKSGKITETGRTLENIPWDCENSQAFRRTVSTHVVE